MKKILTILVIIGLIATLGLVYKKYQCLSCSTTLIYKEKIAYTPEIEQKFLLAQNAVTAFKENGTIPKIA